MADASIWAPSVNPFPVIPDILLRLFLPFETKADFNAALVAPVRLADGAYTVLEDESMNGDRVLYVVEGGIVTEFYDLTIIFFKQTGIGSITRSVVEKLTDLKTSKDWFATNTDTVQNAIDSVINVGELLISQGHDLTTDIAITGYINIKGTNSVLITFSGLGGLIFNGSQRSTIEDIGWSGTSSPAIAALTLKNFSHMTVMNRLLFRNTNVPAIYMENSWDAEHFSIHAITCGRDTGDGQTYIFSFCNNQRFYGQRCEGPPYGGQLYNASIAMYVTGGKMDGGFGIVSTKPGTILQASSEVFHEDYYWAGLGNIHAQIIGQSSFDVINSVSDGGDPFPHFVIDGTPIHTSSIAGTSGANMQPKFSRLRISGCKIKKTHPSVNTVATCVVRGSSTKTVPKNNITISAFAVNGAGNTNISSNGVAVSNNVFNRSYLVNTRFGLTNRMFIQQSFLNGDMVLQGDQTALLAAAGPWQIEYLATDSLDVSIDGETEIEGGLPIFEIVGTIVVGNASTYTAGLTTFSATFTAQVGNCWLRNRTTGHWYRCQASFPPNGNIVVYYDITGEIANGQIMDAYNGRAIMPVLSGEYVYWQEGTTQRRILYSDLLAKGRGLNEIMDRIDGAVI